MDFSLVADPWIPVLTTGGMDVRALPGAFADDVVTVAAGDEVESAAITRLLLAIQIAANHAESHRDPAARATAWIAAHADRFNLFDHESPFWQNPDMARFAELPGAVRPMLSAYRHIGTGSAAVNPRLPDTPGITSPAAAARLLLVRQQFSVGGMQPFTGAAYPKVASTRISRETGEPEIKLHPKTKKPILKSPLSAMTSVATNRGFLWLDTGRLSQSLAATAALTADRPTGRFWFTWPAGKEPADIATPAGVLDGLTWPSRSILLTGLAADQVGGIMICDGLRWPDPDTDYRYTPEREAELLPYSCYVREKKTGPYVVQGVHSSRPVWRQLATMCADPDNPAAAWQPVAADLGARWRLSGVDSFQGGYAGPVAGSFPAPHNPGEVAAFLTRLAEAHAEIGSAAGSMAHAVSGIDGYLPAIPTHTGLTATAEPLAADLATGTITLDEAREHLDAAAAQRTTLAYQSVARVRPRAAGRTLAIKTQAAQTNTKKGTKR